MIDRIALGSFEGPIVAQGTALWGSQKSGDSAMALADSGFEQGLTWLDVAEGYPSPMRIETHGITESIVGDWLTSKPRDQVQITTKAYGPSRQFRGGGASSLEPAEIRNALEGSLRRLRTEYVDMYLLHWPDSEDYDNFFGNSFEHRAAAQVEVLSKLRGEGKLKEWGLSNAEPGDMLAYTEASKKMNVAPPVISQNRINPLTLEKATEGVTLPLQAYGVLGHGVLSGKYLDRECPQGSRLSFLSSEGVDIPDMTDAVSRYLTEAQGDPCSFALNRVLGHDSVVSAVIGFSNEHQISGILK